MFSTNYHVEILYYMHKKKTIQIYLQIGKTYKLGRTVIVTR